MKRLRMLILFPMQHQWNEKTKMVFEEAALPVPEKTFMQTGGKTGTHTEHLGYILADLQYMQTGLSQHSQW
jgi:ring-1,2-phenylacetyl-CoA epoxidase subunit PaaC